MKTLKTYLWRDEQFLLGKLMTFRKGLETKVYLFLEKKGTPLYFNWKMGFLGWESVDFKESEFGK